MKRFLKTLCAICIFVSASDAGKSKLKDFMLEHNIGNLRVQYRLEK